MQLLTYSHLFKSSPKFVMSHTVKGKDFSIVDKIEVAIFLEFSCFLYDPANVSNLISGSFSFSPLLFAFLLFIAIFKASSDSCFAFFSHADGLCQKLH